MEGCLRYSGRTGSVRYDASARRDDEILKYEAETVYWEGPGVRRPEPAAIKHKYTCGGINTGEERDWMETIQK